MELTFDGTAKAKQTLVNDPYWGEIASKLKTGGPLKTPPVTPQLNRNPRKHDVVAWRHDGRLDYQRFETKEAAVEHGQGLCWVVWYQWALMCGRDMVEKHTIDIPEGMGLDDNGLPYKIAS